MKNLIFNLGLPRSGSTVLLKVLNENPSIYSTGTCPVPYLIDNIRLTSLNYPEFMAMKMDSLNDCTLNFIKQGMNGWYSSLTDKPVVISKSRVWVDNLNMIFSLFPTPKIIVSLRDLRDIICSFEKLIKKYPIVNKFQRDFNFESLPLEQRIESYCTEEGGNLGFCLKHLSILIEYMKKYPKSFYVVRYEDFGTNPVEVLKSLYRWMEIEYFEHDLNQIGEGEYYEHDTVYRSLVTHKVGPKLEPYAPQWPKYLNEDQSKVIIENNREFYNIFYPELVK